MASNSSYACVTCRVGGKAPYPICVREGHDVREFYKITIPKKTNKRAWKRIDNGEKLWNRRKVRKNPPNAAYDEKSWVRLPGHKPGQRQTFQPNVPRATGPNVDLGG